ncbi:hypothetical protein S245_060853, partial [Arachis hypogaea]
REANCLPAGSCMSGNIHVRLREKGGGQKWPCCTSLSSSMGSALFFFGRVCQYDLNEVRGFTSDIRWASLFRSLRPGIFVHAINPSGQRLVVGGPAELSEKGSLV